MLHFPPGTSSGPDYSIESFLASRGARFVAGTDEAGAGPLAGPVVAAAVILDPANIPEGLNDSKKLSKTRREELFKAILATSTVAAASVSAREIDRTDIRKARLEAMRRAVCALSVLPCHVLVDGNVVPPGLPMEATWIVRADSRTASVAASSIVAKVLRDRIMDQCCLQYPAYGFSKHSGYGTPEHLKAIAEHGPTPLHRMSFRPFRTH